MREPARGGASLARARALIDVAMLLSQDRSNAARPYRDARISIGAVADGSFQPGLSFATGSPDILFAVAKGEVDVAAMNPSAFLTMACRGTGPFPSALPLRALAVMPSWDRMAFAVAEATGMHSFADLRERHWPLRVSIRRNPAHATRFLVDAVLAAEGITLADIEAWGGSIEYVETPSEASRLDAIERGEVDAVFDEGIKGWGPLALEHGMRFLALGDETRAHLEHVGWPIGTLPTADFPGVPTDLLAPSFSGWPIVTRADLPEEVGYRFAAALDGARAGIAFDWPQPVTLADLCRPSDATALDVALHPGAERYFREQGALD
jgi:TRAP-type uncharacterized transport system substrate-binding protein